MPPVVFVTDRREAGQTLAAVLKRRFGLSWSRAKGLFDGRKVRVGGAVETDPARRLRSGLRIQVDMDHPAGNRGKQPREPEPAATPPATRRAPAAKPKPPGKPAQRQAASTRPGADEGPTPEIVYVDDAVVIVNKLPGLTTMRHRDEADEFGDGQRFLTRTLAGLLPGMLGAPDHRVHAVHRIDRDTSGLVVFARTVAAAAKLTDQFRRHSADRRYLAICRGSPRSGRVESVFVRDRGDGRRGSTTAPAPPDGQRAVTHVKLLESFGPYALVECRLETGRTHQVRIHLGEAGAPLCGERVYDRPLNGRPAPDLSGVDRPMLHAARLGFRHPESGEPMKWEVPPPDDFAVVLARVRAAAAEGGSDS